MLIDVGCALVSIASILFACAIEPSNAACPYGWHVEGVRPSGRYACRTNPPPAIDGRSDRGGWVDLSRDDDARQLDGIIYCTAGSHPIVVTDRVVGCTR